MIKSKLKILLAVNNMNQSELAAVTGIRPQTITNIVNNKIRQIPVDALNAICRELKCDVGDVFEYAKETPQNAEKQAEIKENTPQPEPAKADLHALSEQYSREFINSFIGQAEIVQKHGMDTLKALIEHTNNKPVQTNSQELPDLMKD